MTKHVAASVDFRAFFSTQKGENAPFIQERLGNLLLITSHLVTIATNSTKLTLRDLRTATANSRYT